MRIFRFVPLALLPLLAFLPAPGVIGEEPPLRRVVKEPKTFEIPYRTTIPKHIVVRLKINKKGPFNFILDTGAPALFIATAVADRSGLKDVRGAATVERLEVEGGLVINNAKARVETPFQLEGMNGLGLAGVEIHGMLGYEIIGKYRMEIDFTKDKMTWTELDHTPKLRIPRGAKGGASDELELVGSLMKTFGKFLGRTANPNISLRGFYGMTLEEGDEFPRVTAVLDKGPAGKSGLKSGDSITKMNGRSVSNVADVLQRAGRIAPGTAVKLTIQRGSEIREITVTSGEGI